MDVPTEGRRPADDPVADHGDWRRVTRTYRRNPGGLWWLALIGVPLLLALVGLLTGRATVTAAPASPSAVPTATVAPAPFSLVRSGGTVTGTTGDAAARIALLDAARAALGNGIKVTDRLAVAPGTATPPLSVLAPLFRALKANPVLAIAFDGTKISLSGTVEDEASRTALVAAATAAFGGAPVDSRLEVAPSGPSCATVKADVAALTKKTRIVFATGGSELTEAAAQTLAEIAERVSACPDVRLVVAGNTDNVGDPARNQQLSLARARLVADLLAQQGVAPEAITAVGNGSSKPIASNATAAGQAINRRVDITVK